MTMLRSQILSIRPAARDINFLEPSVSKILVGLKRVVDFNVRIRVENAIGLLVSCARRGVSSNIVHNPPAGSLKTVRKVMPDRGEAAM